MTRRFVRSIKNTKLTGDNKEPLETNNQNDLLSNGVDVFVRNNAEYHNITDNVKKIISKNNSIKINVLDKNTVELEAKNFGDGKDGENGLTPNVSFRLDETGNLYYQVEYKE